MSVVAIVALLTVPPACGGHRASASVPEQEVDLCTGYALYDALTEPDPADPKAVLTYVETFAAIVAKIDTEKKVRNPTGKLRSVPTGVVPDVRILTSSLARFRAAVKSAKADPEALRKAQSDFSNDQSYVEAASRLTTYRSASCRR